MNDRTRQNLTNRGSTIRERLGAVAYERQEHVLKIEAIDEQVAAMEAQLVLIDATMADLNADLEQSLNEEAERVADAKAKRSKVAKAAAARRRAKA